MTQHIKVRKGFDIPLKGKAKPEKQIFYSDTVAIKPTDFLGMYRPKVVVKQGQSVKAGTPLFYDKKMEQVLYTSPVSGEIVEIQRGAKRKLLAIIILADKPENMEYEDFGKYFLSDIQALSEEAICKHILKSGLWPFIVQRPFAITADPNIKPKSIFVSCFDTAPLAPDYEILYKNQQNEFKVGLQILHQLTGKMIHLGVNKTAEFSSIFKCSMSYVETHKFSGKHPAGNVGTHIAYIDPIRKKDVIWTISPLGVIQIGKLFLEGKYLSERTIALAGAEVENPQYYQVPTGVSMDKILQEQIKTDNVRIISGNALTGEQISQKGYLGFYDQMITVLLEGNRDRFFLTEGWLAPIKERLSFHRAIGLLSFLNGKKKEYQLDTSNNGESRPFVMSGHFESVMPMNIYLTHLLKAILAEDYDQMEALGILELAEEDVALAEFIDVSKHEIQSILRKGINLLREA